MIYSTSNLSLPDAQRILLERQVEKTSLERRRDQMLESQSSSSTGRAETEAELASTTTLLEQVTAEIAGLPEGPEKQQKLIEQSKLVTIKLALEESVNFNDGSGITEKEFDLAIVQRRIAETDVYIAAIQARINELNG